MLRNPRYFSETPDTPSKPRYSFEAPINPSTIFRVYRSLSPHLGPRPAPSIGPSDHSPSSYVTLAPPVLSPSFYSFVSVLKICSPLFYSSFRTHSRPLLHSYSSLILPSQSPSFTFIIHFISLFFVVEPLTYLYRL
jgi:hypothetical protein